MLQTNSKENKTNKKSHQSLHKQTKQSVYKKNIENIDYLLKVADKNKRQLQESYGRQLEKIEKKISKNEQILHKVLEEINEKENQIYEVQKIKLEGFKNEVEKFEKIKNLVEEHLLRLSYDINREDKEKNKLTNQTLMLYEDYLSYNNEAYMSKNKILELKETLNQIEKTYPKDFEFLFEDIQIEKQLNEMENLKNSIQKEIKTLELEKVKFTNEKLDKEERKELVDVEFKKIDEQIEECYKDSHLRSVEDYLIKNVSNLLEFQNLQSLVQGFYNMKHLDIENEINVLVIKNLAEKLTEMKNEFYQMKNDKMNQLSKIAQDIEDIKNQSNKKAKFKGGVTTNNQLLIEDQIKAKKEEGEKIYAELSKMELNCKKKETLFNKYLILLRNKCTKSDEESYFKNNPSIILENNFEELFKQEMINNLKEKREDLCEDDIKKYEGTIDIYFRDLFERERTIQLILLQRTKIEKELNQHLDAINHVNDSIHETENEIKLKKMRLQEVLKSLKDLQQRIETRNKTLKMNLENLSENNFMEYLNSNEDVLKSMKKIYGNKVLSKVFKAQKDKFYENVMLDHTFKKSKINEFVFLVNSYESVIQNYDNAMSNLLESFKESSYNLDKTKELIDMKKKEESALREARNELLTNLDSMLFMEMDEITNEKIKLRQKLNCDFYFVKVKEIAQKIEQLKQEKEKIMNEFFQFRDVIIDKEQRLYKDELDTKKQITNLEDDINFDLYSSKFIKSTDRIESNQVFRGDNLNSPSTIPFKVNSNTLNQICEKESDLDDIERGIGEQQIDNNMFSNNKKNNFDEEVSSYKMNNTSGDNILVNNNKFERRFSNEDEQLEGSNEQYEYKSREGSLIHQSPSQRLETTINLYEQSNKLDPQSSQVKLTLEKLYPFIIGMPIYKKHGSSLNKIFDVSKAKENPPESCGYAQRTIYLNDNYIEFKKDRKVEYKVKVSDLKSILLAPQTKKMIAKYKKNISTNPNSNQLISKQKQDEINEFVQFKLILENESLDLIAHNFIAFISFNDSVEELVKYKKQKSLEDILELTKAKK